MAPELPSVQNRSEFPQLIEGSFDHAKQSRSSGLGRHSQASSRHTPGVSRIPGTKEALSSRAGLSSTVRSPFPGATGGTDTQAPLSKHCVLPFPIWALLLRKETLLFCFFGGNRGPTIHCSRPSLGFSPVEVPPRPKHGLQRESRRASSGSRGKEKESRARKALRTRGSLTSEKKETNHGRGTEAQEPSSRGSRSSAF